MTPAAHLAGGTITNCLPHTKKEEVKHTIQEEVKIMSTNSGQRINSPGNNDGMWTVKYPLMSFIPHPYLISRPGEEKREHKKKKKKLKTKLAILHLHPTKIRITKN